MYHRICSGVGPLPLHRRMIATPRKPQPLLLSQERDADQDAGWLPPDAVIVTYRHKVTKSVKAKN